MRIGCPKPYMRMSPLYVNAKMNNCNGKIPVRLIKTYNIQLLDENTLVIETGVSAKDILLIEEYKKEIMDALKARQKAEQASASEFQDKIDAIPGLKEVESALEDVATWSYIRRDKTPPEYDLQSMQVKYPRAFAYLKSREYERSANRMKAQAGRDAAVKIVNGEDYQAVIAEMEELVAEHIFL